ncbi:MAG TPA: hypothetical protein VF339_12210 [Gammaproteobacteria bacterium]
MSSDSDEKASRDHANLHARSIVVWDVPSAIERGATFSVKVGIKCSAECVPDTWVFGIRDHEGRVRASRRVGPEPWPGTAALFYAEAELEAPASEGLFAWEAFAPAIDGDGDDVGHGDACAKFSVRVVPAPECRLTVVAIDKESRSPVAGAKVVVHPYRAITDERGVAELRVPKGPFRLFVSGRDYFPFRHDADAVEDVTVTAELEADLGPSDAELWS